MRRNLRPDELGDLLQLPLNAVIALHRRDGSVMQTPVWHEWTGSAFRFYIPAGDRKIEMLGRDGRISLVVADSAFPFRTMQVEGTAHVTTDGFRDVARRIATRYVTAHDPKTPIEEYIGAEDGAVVEVEASSVRAWDYADMPYV
jgi:PPOX class probable F420-dependent enzyme